MANKQVFLTADGLAALENELDHLKTVVRKEVSEKIKVARGFGDLSENSEYDEAKNEQAQVESRIAELEATLKLAVVIDEDSITTDVVKIGTRVKMRDTELGEIDEYQIVGSTEANPKLGCISDESPVGRALLGHKIGDIVAVETPGGIIHFEVLDISR
ncbi:MAG: transcription elongation factor GreA [Clostridia bacterium]|nr:transcription elongation factor GreA [Clostridia bacterium]